MFNYFYTLFKSEVLPTADVAWVLYCMQTRFSSELLAYLDTPFSTEEIGQGVFEMAPTKAPGPNGLPALFYQKFWDTIGGNVVKGCLRFLNEGEPIGSINETLICLIPKIVVVEHVNEFRPIIL